MRWWRLFKLFIITGFCFSEVGANYEEVDV